MTGKRMPVSRVPIWILFLLFTATYSFFVDAYGTPLRLSVRDHGHHRTATQLHGASGGPNSTAFSNVASIVKLHHSGNLHNSGGSWGTQGLSCGPNNTMANIPSRLALHNSGNLNNSFSTIGASVVAPPAPLGRSLSNHDRPRRQDAGVLAASVHSSASSKGSSVSSWAGLGASSGSEHFSSVVSSVAAPHRASARSSVSSWGTLGHSAGSASFPSVSASALQL